MIAGNTGTGGVTLNYTVGPAKTLKSDSAGNYAFPVPNNWSGTVTLSKTGYAFTPARRTYANVTTDQPQQNYIATPVTTLTFASVGQYDGWILESSETSGAQLPDTAVISKATLKLKLGSVAPAGTNPITLLQGILVDGRKGFFGTSPALQLADFQATADKTLGPFTPVLSTGWYTITLSSVDFINKLAASSGVTQFRLRFKLDDNNNAIANTLNIASGDNTVVANRPTLVIDYYVP